MGRTRTRVAPAGRLGPIARDLVDGFEAQRDEAVEEVVRAILEEVPGYRSLEVTGRADVAAHVGLNHDALVRFLRQDRPLTREDLMFVRAPTTRRASARLPLSDYLQAFRIGYRVMWAQLVSGAEDVEAQAAALSLVRPVMEYINLVSTHAAEVYVDVEQRLLAEVERVRRDVLEDLLEGRRPPVGPREEAMRSAGLSGTTPYAVVAAFPRSSEGAEYAMRTAAMVFTRLAGTTTPMSVQRGDELVLIAAVGEDRGRRLAAGLRSCHDRLLGQGVTPAIGMSTVVTGLEHVPAAYREACEARHRVEGTGGVLALCELAAFDYLTLIGDETAQRLISDDVARFVEDDLADEGALTATLLEYVACDLNAKVAAERLFVHVNTMHYRLARIGERTGRDLRRLADVLELLIAVKLATAARPL
jgi:DNA-binding PucR family transcriptional regulator